ncbi:MAG TPA: zinc-binding dehydrogenase [Burkholderiaceae bacterium]|nr:zinc-binding dehydrogenase [Burkholderiaceae bacterium]
MAGTMKAWVQTGFGGPEVRVLQEVPRPVAAADEVVVKVIACALNRLDVLQRRAPLVATFRLPHIAGMDIVGEVVQSGSAQGESLLGNRVVIDPVVTCGHCDMCRAELPMYCRNFRTIGSSRDGGLAEFVAVPARNCIAADSSHTTLEQLACVPVASVTAWHGLIAVGRIQAGETIVVPGAGSGLGVAGVQISKQRGCRVITTVGGAGKVEAARALGADLVIDRSRTDWVAEARRITGDVGVDMVWDHVGGPFLQQAIDALRIGGRVVLSGSTAGNQSCFKNTSLFQWGKSLLGHGGYTPQEMRAVVAAYDRGELRVVVDSRWPFSKLPQAEQRLESDDFFGKIVVWM